jgi:ketosteroid isomerase-like protein
MSLSAMAFFVLAACDGQRSVEQAKREVILAERAFESMLAAQGMAAAFSHFSDTQTVLLRQGDSLIMGREAIWVFYSQNADPRASLSWAPQFVDVSNDGTMAYTYGHYLYQVPDSSGQITKHRGVFHSVWKRKGGEWKLVWD